MEKKKSKKEKIEEIQLQVQNLLQCQICYNKYTDINPALTLNCGHSGCKNCLYNWWYKNAKINTRMNIKLSTCPFCRNLFDYLSLKPNTNLKDLIELETNISDISLTRSNKELQLNEVQSNNLNETLNMTKGSFDIFGITQKKTRSDSNLWYSNVRKDYKNYVNLLLFYNHYGRIDSNNEIIRKSDRWCMSSPSIGSVLILIHYEISRYLRTCPINSLKKAHPDLNIKYIKFKLCSISKIFECLNYRYKNKKKYIFNHWKYKVVNKTNFPTDKINPNNNWEGKYYGEIKENKRHGFGEYIFKDKSIYLGNWYNDQMCGQGRFINLEGKEFEGNWKNGVLEGYGKMFYKNRLIYNGEWLDGRFNGIGRYYDINDFKFDLVGSWKDGELDGYSSIFMKDGSNYKGELKRNKYHGYGYLKHSNGDIYQGNWLNGEKCGEGKYISESGDIYEGQFSNDLRNGEGILKTKDGIKYSGYWLCDKFNGKGILIDKNNKVVCGKWKDGNLIKKYENCLNKV